MVYCLITILLGSLTSQLLLMLTSVVLFLLRMQVEMDLYPMTLELVLLLILAQVLVK